MITLISFLVFIALFIGVGLFSIKYKKKHVNDYYVASRSVSAPFVGLSAVASLMSGFMFLGAIGAVYKNGLVVAWYFVCSFITHVLAYMFYIGKFSKICEKRSFATFTQFLSKTKNSFFYKYSILASLIVIIFLGAMASAQLLSGAKTLNSFYDIDMKIGGLIVVCIVLLYCYAGGIRASIWTDVAQSVVMMISMVTLLVIAINSIGGFDNLIIELKKIDSTKYTSMIVANSFHKTTYSFLGNFILAGAVALGIPYVMVRYMTLSDTKKTKKVGFYFTGYMAIFYTSAMLIGLCARVLINPETLPDSENAFLVLSRILLPEFMVGIILAGIFASIISTTDSLLLVCSASITKDVFPKLGNKYSYAKLSTLFVALIVYGIFFIGSRNIFELVLFSVGATGCAFAPILILKIHNKNINEITQILMSLTTVFLYIYWNKHYHNIIHEAFPAVASSFLVYGLGELYYKIKNITSKPKQEFAIGE
jgi:SSS family transporter